MTTKSSRLITEILTVFTLFGVVGCAGDTPTTSTPNIQPAVPTGKNPAVSPVRTPPNLTASTPKSSQHTIRTTFNCVRQPTGWATIAQRGNAISQSPLLTWNSAEFGTDWTPEQRCKTVSQRLTNAVAKNSGKLSSRTQLITQNSGLQALSSKELAKNQCVINSVQLLSKLGFDDWKSR